MFYAQKDVRFHGETQKSTRIVRPTVSTAVGNQTQTDGFAPFRKIDQLEVEVQSLKELLQSRSLSQNPCNSCIADQHSTPVSSRCSVPGSGASLVSADDGSQQQQLQRQHTSPNEIPSWHQNQPTSTSNQSSSNVALPSRHSKPTFVIRDRQIPDLVTAGLLSEDTATSCFTTFFSGCDRYVPIFDPHHDTMASIRSRSSLLFCVICTVGYRVLEGTETREWRRLDLLTKQMLTAATISSSSKPTTVETVQALLVRACYTPDRTILLALATRMALEIGLPEAYYNTLRGPHMPTMANNNQTHHISSESADAHSMRMTRTWLHLVVLGNMLHVDAGNAPSFEFSGNVRRCRVLLDRPCSTSLDFSLFSQVELNVLRADVYTRIANLDTHDEDGRVEIVSDARIDLDVWYTDWIRIHDDRFHDGSNTSWMRINLQIQRCWSECMALCRVVRSSGVEDVSAMSPSQKHILSMAKNALMQHFVLILEEPQRLYLHHLRYAMDFVWAKCAFCFLLLLKLSILLPDVEESSRDLVKDGEILVNELAEVMDNMGGQESGNNSRRAYLQLLQSGLEKYRCTLLQNGQGHQSSIVKEGGGRQGELESFVPDQFVFEWDFPGLSFFSSPSVETDWLDEFLSGSFGVEDEPFSLDWL